jgi:hypothetical protein
MQACGVTTGGYSDEWRVSGGAMKVRELIKLIEEDGWFLIATRGSHRQYKHLVKAVV